MAEPWEVKNSPWKDKKAFLNWLRSQTRRIWAKHPVKTLYRQMRRYKAPVGVNDKEVWVSDCEICGKQTRKTEIDHMVEGGSFQDWQSYTEWSKRILWVSFEDIRELCVDCHAAVTLSQRKGLSFSDAVAERQVIAICKGDDKAWLISKGHVPESNAKKRRDQIRKIIKEEQD